jgi:hypothetical protein
MRKIILTYGLIAGAIVAGLMFASMPFWKSGALNFDNGEIVGYTTMVISLSMVFFGIKSCRDFHFNGSISFWQAVKVGMLITLIASVVYALAWEISYHTVASDFTEKMTQHYLEKMKSEAKNETEVNAAIEQMENFKEWYKNPILRFGITITEILPVGIIITLLSALLLRKKEILPSN